jgi:para-nitrobenzyl esterase
VRSAGDSIPAARYDVGQRTTGLLGDTLTAADDPAGDERALWDAIR